MLRIIDLSLVLEPDMPVYTGDPDLEINRITDIAESGYSLSELKMSVHSGTHVDTPAHFLEIGGTVDKYDLGRFIGNVILVDLHLKEPGEDIGIDDLKPYENALVPGSRVVLRTDWDKRFGTEEYYNNHPSVTSELAEWFVDRRISFLGTDMPGLSSKKEAEVHRILMCADIIILEAMANLDKIKSPVFLLMAAPLNLKGAEGSPVRAFAIEDS